MYQTLCNLFCSSRAVLSVVGGSSSRVYVHCCPRRENCVLLKSGAYAPLFRGRVSGLAGLEKVFRRGICSPVCPVVCAWYDPPLSPHPPPPGCQGSEAASILQWSSLPCPVGRGIPGPTTLGTDRVQGVQQPGLLIQPWNYLSRVSLPHGAQSVYTARDHLA